MNGPNNLPAYSFVKAGENVVISGQSFTAFDFTNRDQSTMDKYPTSDSKEPYDPRKVYPHLYAYVDTINSTKEPIEPQDDSRKV